jgi:hypothetical protein
MAIITVKNRAITLDAAEIPNLDAAKITSGSFADARIPNLATSKITSGTFADARIAASNVSQHATSFDDNKLVNDLSTLGLRVHTQENLNVSNTNSASFDVFQDSSGVTNLTNSSRTSDEYIATVYTTTGEFSNDSNTILLMHFNGDLTDSSSNNMGGQFTLSNMDSSNFVTSDYKFGSHSLLFNGTNEHVYSSNLNDHDSSVAFPTTGDFTIEHWFKYDSTSNSNTERIMSIGNSQNSPSGGSTPGLSWGYSGGSTTQWNTYGDYSNNYNWGQNSFGTQDTTTWHHIAYVRKSGTLYSYLDGVYKGNDNFYNGNNMNSTGIIFFSNRSGGNNEWFGGKIDEVRISNTDRYDTTQSAGTQVFTPNQITATNATGSFEGATITAGASTSKMGAVITYQDNAGTNTLNTDIILKLSADNGSNYSTATLTALPNFATGIKMAKVNDLSVTAGTQLKYKIEFANQASGSKEARIRGVSLQY